MDDLTKRLDHSVEMGGPESPPKPLRVVDDLSKRLDRLGRAVSDVAERLAEPRALELSRHRFLGARAARRSAHPRAWFALGAAACVALAVVVVARFGASPSAVSFQVGVAGEHGAVGAWIAATGGETLPLRFSEGTTLVLSPRTQVRVTETSARGAGVLIEQGQIDASVVHTGQDTRWAIVAGPYRVRVTGTRFRASWSPTTEIFELAMVEGSVVVTGPLLPQGRVCEAGERLRASSREGRLSVSMGGPESPPKPPENRAETTGIALSPAVSMGGPESPPKPPESRAENRDPAENRNPAENRSPAENRAEMSGIAPGNGSSAPRPSGSGFVLGGAPDGPAGRPVAARVPEPTWRSLFAAGKYKEAFAAADRAGFSAEIERASAPDLFALADVARYGGRPADARAALLAARARGSRGRSAFLLGKVAADQQGSPGEAVTWFETYLREEPGGALAEQALGRVMELRRRGDAAAARAVAARYLAIYPHGAYSKLAQSLVAP